MIGSADGFSHPGGMEALSLADGRDATEMFELHHQFSDSSNMKSILDKYEVQPRELIGRSGTYDWSVTRDSLFAKDLKESARSVLGSNIKATNARFIEYFVLFITLLSQWYCLLNGYWFAVLTFPLALWVFSVNIFHDAGHFAIWGKYWRLNSLAMNAGFMLATPYHWYHQHTLAHHSFPNVLGKDPDLYHVPDSIRHSVDVPVTRPHCSQHWSFIFIATFGLPGYYLCGGAMQCLLGLPYNDVVELSSSWYLHPYGGPLRLVAYLMLMHVLPLIAHGLTLKAAIFSIVPEFIYMACFTLCSQVNHLTPECTDKFHPNFFIHQVITSHNINTQSYFTTIFMGGLNMQIEHHLFPSVNHCHLRKLAPHVKALCLKHNVPYAESTSLWAAVMRHVEHLYNMGSIAYEEKRVALKKME